MGVTEVTVDPTVRVRPAVPTSPNALCLRLTLKTPDSAPPNMAVSCLVESSTETTLSLLTIVELAWLVTLMLKCSFTSANGKSESS